METGKNAACFENGSVVYEDRTDSTYKSPWNKHPQYNGVYLKHIITGKDTGGKFSCHMVKVEPACSLEEHAHEKQWELHEILEGDGRLVLELKESLYFPGAMGVIPQGARHKICAGKNGLVLLAEFFPALL